MKNRSIAITIIVFVVVIGALLLFRNYRSTPTLVGGDRDREGCLVPAGYSFDAKVGACIRSFEFTDDIERAAQMAVDKVGRSYALTVVSFNSYEDVGSYDITLERGIEREKVVVYIKNWKIISESLSF